MSETKFIEEKELPENLGVVCPDCDGVGEFHGHNCWECDGTGKTTIRDKRGDHAYFREFLQMRQERLVNRE